MHNKYIRLFTKEPQFRLKWIVLTALLTGSLGLLLLKSYRHAQVVRMQKEAGLVEKISEFEKIIQDADLVMPPPEPAPLSSDLVLAGTSEKKGTMYALINDQIVTVGDQVKNYQIVSIAMGRAVLKDTATNEVRSLYFQDEF
jgi:hypothetical protein